MSKKSRKGQPQKKRGRLAALWQRVKDFRASRRPIKEHIAKWYAREAFAELEKVEPDMKTVRMAERMIVARTRELHGEIAEIAAEAEGERKFPSRDKRQQVRFFAKTEQRKTEKSREIVEYRRFLLDIGQKKRERGLG